MSEGALTLHRAESFQVPAIVVDVGPEATKRFFEFFTVPVRNKNTRIAYYHAIGEFLAWSQRCGFQSLEDIEPITVAAYIEQHPGSPATIKQHMAGIRMFFSWLTQKGVLPINPAREVKTPKFSRTEGKTPAFSAEQVRTLLDSIDTSHLIGHRDKALLATWRIRVPGLAPLLT
jgi:integrase/recombinase XerD